MSHAIQLFQQIHQRAVEVSSRYLRTEVELIDVLEQVDSHRVFIRMGYSSLFQYAVKELGLSESVTCNLSAVMRKAKEVPELKAKMAAGQISLSNARRIAPVLTPDN